MKQGYVTVALLGILLGFTSQAMAIPLNGLVGHWPGEGNANDVSGNNHHGVLENGTGFTSGKIGQAFSLDGQDDFVSFPTINFEDIDTLSLWVKTPTVDQSIMDGGPTFFTWRLEVDAQGRAVYQHFRNGPSGFNGYISLTSNTVIADEEFHHLTAITDQSNNMISLFVDGALEATYTETDPLFNSWTFAEVGDTKLGKNDTLGLPQDLFFSGVVDELMLYDRVLTDVEIEMLASVPAPLPEPPTVLLLGLTMLFLSAKKEAMRTG